MCAIDNSNPENAFFVLHRARIERCLFLKPWPSDACSKQAYIIIILHCHFCLTFLVSLLHDFQILYTDVQIF